MLMKKIFLLTDFSDAARNATDYALELFGANDVEYTLINTYALPDSGAEMLISFNDILRQESEEGLEKELNLIRQTLPGQKSTVKTISEYGYLSNVMEKMTIREKPDFIVLGTTGATGFRRFFFGSNTSAVLRRIHCPALIVPPKCSFSKPKHIAFASDMELIPGHIFFQPLTDIVHKYQAQLSVVHVQAEEIIAGAVPVMEDLRLRHMFRNTPYQFFEIKGRNPINSIYDFVHTNKVDILSMIAHKYNFFDSLIHSSSTREMAKLTDIPLVVLRETDDF